MKTLVSMPLLQHILAAGLCFIQLWVECKTIDPSTLKNYIFIAHEMSMIWTYFLHILILPNPKLYAVLSLERPISLN